MTWQELARVIDVPDLVSYVHTQSVPSAVWTIVHERGFCPNVTVLDTTGRTVWGDVAYPDPDTVVLTFSAAFSGLAYLS